MDETAHEDVELQLFNLMIASKGGLQWKELQKMPLPEVFALIKYVNKINEMQDERIKREMKREMKRAK